MILRYTVYVFLVLFSATLATAGDNWPQFRGPTGDGHSDATGLPLTWSETENVVWKTAIHGRGHSSPVVWDGQVWMTTATEDGLEMFAVCVDLQTGKILHNVKVFENHEEDIQASGALNSFASPTPVIEPGRLYVHFGTYGTACLDTPSGKTLWQRRDLHCDHSVGPGSSAFVCDDRLILHYDGIDVQYLAALNKATGKTIWRTDRSTDFGDVDGELRKAFCTPIVIRAGGRRQLISPGAKAAMAYDPTTGEELWKVRYGGWSNTSRPVFGHGLVLINTGYPRATLWAVRSDGHGDVTDTHVAWKLERNVSAKPSPLLIEDLLFMVDDSGIASCIEATTGESVWRKRIGGKYSASPIYADGRIYCFSHEPKTTVIQPGREFTLLAENELDEGFMASPAVAGKALILRTKTHLYRIEQRE